MIKISPLLWIVFSAFIIVLLIPSILVVSFSENKGNEELDLKIDKNNVMANEAANQAVEVSVYRTSLKEIENVSFEEYVVGVVASEMPATFELEALKAQALAARTFLVNKMVAPDSSKDEELLRVNADISDNPENYQVYKNKAELAKQWGENYQSNITKIQEAVHATQGQILTYEGKPIDPSFHSTSNGYTENSEDYWEHSYPYLRSVASPWDKESPKFNDQVVVTISEVEKALGIQLDRQTDIIGEKKLTESNRVATIEIDDQEFTGVHIREKLGLPSNDFEVEQSGENLIFTTKGYGHGVGMSQYGANGMAKEGKNYEDIVKYYYQDVSISSVEPFVDTIVAKK